MTGREQFNHRRTGTIWTSIACCTIIMTYLTACTNRTSNNNAIIGEQTLNVAQSALAGGNPRMALSVTNAVLKLNPSDAKALIMRGDAYYLMDNCTHAILDYRHALRTRPDNANAEIGLGRCTLHTDPKVAGRYFTRAVSDNSTSAIALNDLGIAMAAQGQFQSATGSFRSALSIDPTMRAARVNLGMALALGGQPRSATLTLGPLARAPEATPQIRADDATALVLAGDIKQARRLLLTDMPANEAQTMIDQVTRLGQSLTPGAHIRQAERPMIRPKNTSRLD